MHKIVLASSAALLLSPLLHAQTFTTAACNAGEGQSNFSLFGMGTEHVCELRKTVLPARGEVKVSSSNGGIEVIGQDRSDIALEARVVASAGSRGDAESLAHEIKIDVGDTIHADGPGSSIFNRRSWYVNFRLLVPRRVAEQLHTVNGGIELSGVDGNARAETTNGGISLRNLGGEVHVRTTNGGIAVALSGDHWDGAGLDANTTNGGITIGLPAHYSAHVVAQTTNGGLSINVPMQGVEMARKHIDVSLGRGGATLEFQTVNGGVTLGHATHADPE